MAKEPVILPPGYAVIPIKLLRDRSIPSYAKVVYMSLWYFENIKHKPPVSLMQLAAMTNISYALTLPAIKILKEKNLVFDVGEPVRPGSKKRVSTKCMHPIF
jgi:hypothetical protein